MGDVTLVVLTDQRHGDSLDPHGCVALTCGRKDIPQRPLDPCIGGHQPPTSGTQDIACGKKGDPTLPDGKKDDFPSSYPKSSDPQTGVFSG